MRILLVSQTYYPYLDSGGPAVKVPGLAEALARRGNQVTVVTTSHENGFGSHSLERGGVEIVYLRQILRYRIATVNPGILAFLRKHINGYEASHIFGLYDILGPMVASRCRREGIPYVVEPLGMFTPRLRSVRKKRIHHRLFGRKVLAGAGAYVVTSERERDELILAGTPPERIVLRPNGVDAQAFATLPARGAMRRHLGLPPSAPLVLFLGRVVRIKGLDLLIDAFARLDPTTHLVIAGPDGNDGTLQQLRRQAERGSLGGRVHLPGPLYGDAKLQAFADADLLVLPSHYESFGNAAAEAMAAGVPVVVTEGCGIASLVRGGAGIVSAHEPQALAAAMQRLLQDADARIKMVETGRVAAAGLSWDRLAEQMERLYLSLGATS